MILPPRYKSARLDEDDIHDLHQKGEIFTWTDRDNYLQWISDWKAVLKEQIAEIRRMKAIYRDPSLDTEARAMAQSERHYLRIYCANLFLMRRMAKQLSATQRRSRLAA